MVGSLSGQQGNRGNMKTPVRHVICSSASLIAALLALVPAASQAQKYPITPQQRAAAESVATKGVPLADIRADAPKEHVVVKGDTLWAISKLFLNSPWRWPELWGMNLDQIPNPHLIYPGQKLVLTIKDGRATLGLSTGQGVIGVIENMSYLEIGGEKRELFGSGGGEAVAQRLSALAGSDVSILGKIAISEDLRVASDQGTPAVVSAPEDAASQEMMRIAKLIAARPRGLSGKKLSLGVI